MIVLTTAWVAVLVCTGEPDHPADKANYSLEICQQDGHDIAVQYYVLTGKKCNYKCIQPDYEPKEIK